MIILFSYVKYSEASFPMSSGYTTLFFITLCIWILLWLGYRKNKINDEQTAREKKERIKAKIERRKKLDSLYPNKKQN
tara:strand:+ start:9073 stop:9306 length:234 start_codon:yes stop_codon:yes gene_type:complete